MQKPLISPEISALGCDAFQLLSNQNRGPELSCAASDLRHLRLCSDRLPLIGGYGCLQQFIIPNIRGNL